MKDKTCCFSGHSSTSQKKIEKIVKRLNDEVDCLIQQGVKSFICGGALGFDHIAASMVISKKQQGKDIRLVFALPCRNQDEKWTDRQKRLYHSLLNEADEVYYVSEEYTPDCIKDRNHYMVDNSAYCICTLLRDMSGTGQTVRYAQGQAFKAY